jgi:hypothetical protein
MLLLSGELATNPINHRWGGSPRASKPIGRPTRWGRSAGPFRAPTLTEGV